MRYLLVVGFFISSILSANAQTAKYWQQEVNYTIQVQLDDILHSLDGFETIVYTNHSPDTLKFIWFHIWENAYKNDKTAFSEQLLRNGRSDFYFSDEQSKGYVNRLSFKVNNERAVLVPDSANIDIAKLILPAPLAPNETINISTPFHVNLPKNFSRGGHIGQTYQITQWYPKPAVYDALGWHPIPYLDQGEFYSEFGNYDVQITLPDNYIVAASGILQNTTELDKLINLSKTKLDSQANYKYFLKKSEQYAASSIAKHGEVFSPKSAATSKTLHYLINNAHDFAWFASKQYLVMHDTVQLQHKTIDVFTYFPPWNHPSWDSSLLFAKNGLRYYDKHVGDYPYNIASVVSGSEAIGSGGMEYPSVTLITTQSGGKELDITIAHELGHNWFYGSLGSNERDHAWMDEGMNSFEEHKYTQQQYPPHNKYDQSFEESIETSLIAQLEHIGKDQPIDLTSAAYPSVSYGLYVYKKTCIKLLELEKQLGTDEFEKAMKSYYSQWQYKHPYPINFKTSIESSAGKSIDTWYQSLFTTAAQRTKEHAPKKQLRFGLFGNLKNTDKYNYISASPMVGYNAYDKLMIGGAIHNYQLPLTKFNFIAAPLYATGTNQLNYYGRMSYRFQLQHGILDNININSSFSTFTYKHINFIDSLFPAQYNVRFYKIDPTIRFNFRNNDILSRRKAFLQIKAFQIGEEDYASTRVKYNTETFDSSYIKLTKRSLLQLKFRIEDFRTLYPYNFELTVDAGKTFLRAGATANYFLNYPEGKNKGINVRAFAGKFFHLKQDYPYDDYRYYLSLTGPRGDQDYTYSNYFVGRGDFEGFNSQQLMERDGFFKVGTEQQGQIGLTDKWLAAANFTGNIPSKYNPLEILPFKLPIKFFFDIGTYAEAWNENATGSRFLYDAGFQLSLFNSCLNLYVPLLYSSVYRDYYKSIFPDKSFSKSISFSIDIQKIQLQHIVKGLPL